MRIREAVWTGIALLVAGACGGERQEARVTDKAASPAAAVTQAAPEERPGPAMETETGEATFYADVLDRQRTASGEPLDQNEMVAAHRRFPFGTILRVTNLENRASVQVRVIDRGPFGAPRDGARRVIDLSRGAAERLGFIDQGSVPVRVEVIEYGEGVPAA